MEKPLEKKYYDVAAKIMLKNLEKGNLVYVNGSKIDFSKYGDVEMIIENGTSLIPIRAICEAMGASVDWNGKNQTVTIDLNGLVVELAIDSKQAKVNGKKVTIDVPARIVNDRTIVPLRFIAESFNRKVNWKSYGNDLAFITIND
jgi:hypothetical protein